MPEISEHELELFRLHRHVSCLFNDCAHQAPGRRLRCHDDECIERYCEGEDLDALWEKLEG